MRMCVPSAITICVLVRASVWHVFSIHADSAEILSEIEPVDRLKFKDKKRYRDRLSAAQKSTGEKDALIAMRGTLQGLPLIAVAFEFEFHGGSMGYAVGEKVHPRRAIWHWKKVFPWCVFPPPVVRACRRP